MQKTEKFFIFSWKELTVIAMLFVISVAFFFTLGLHYGKKLSTATENHELAAKLEESSETLPARETLEEGSQHTSHAAQDSIRAATQEEITESNLKIDAPKPVDLPAEVEKPATAVKVEHNEGGAETAAVSESHFGIQLGSYPSKKEAQLKIKSLAKRGLNPAIRTAEVAGQTRYRVVLTGFKTRALADAKAKDLKQKRKIESYVVIKSE